MSDLDYSDDQRNSWQSARDDFGYSVLPKLERDGLKIGEAANAGDERARLVIRHYGMLHRSFDPITLELLKEALRNYYEGVDGG